MDARHSVSAEVLRSVGDVSPHSDLGVVVEAEIKAHYQAQFSVSYRRTVYLLLDLLFVKFASLSVSRLSQAAITYAVDSICMS